MDTQNKIAVACDHGGFALKQEIIKHLNARNLPFIDFGTDSEASVNYPDYAALVCEAVESGECPRGILICGTGIGMSIAANKHAGIRAALCGDTFSARMTRMHNDANVLCLGARVTGTGLALDIVDLFLGTAFEGGRHAERIALVMKCEEKWVCGR